MSEHLERARELVRGVKKDLRGIGSFVEPDAALGVMLSADPHWLDKRAGNLAEAESCLAAWIAKAQRKAEEGEAGND